MARRITSAWAAAACAVTIVTACSRASAVDQKPTDRKAPVAVSTPSVTTPTPLVTKPNPPIAPAAPPVTFTGCLEAHGTKYVLTGLKGDAAPKGRNWKTAFIKKTKKDVEVVSASSTLKLKEHVGRQITVTGVRVDDDHLKARSVKRIAASCS